MRAVRRRTARAGGRRRPLGRDLLAALLDRAGWPRAVAAMAPGGTEALLAPSFGGGFGRLRLAGGDTLAPGPSEAPSAPGASALVAFYNPRTRETRVLRPRASWSLPGSAVDEWMFRLGADNSAAKLLAVPAATLGLAASASAAPLPAIEEGRVYTAQDLAGTLDRGGGRGDLVGWARVPWLRAGDRVRLSTFDLADDVDTVVEIHHDAAAPERDDDGGEELASRLEWTAVRTGEVLVRLVNTGVPGAFRLKAERLPRAPDAAAATDRVRPVSQPSRPR